MTSSLNTQSRGLDVYRIGWRYYKKIKKKAVDSKSGTVGFAVGLSIAFFVVIITAFALKLLYISFENTKINNSSFNNIKTEKIQIYGDYSQIPNLV